MSTRKVIAVLPAYNAAKTLECTLADIPRNRVAEIILVDDASSDGTPALARSLGITTIVHPKNRGYGGNQKTCYNAARERGADVVIMIHPDHQYDPTLLPNMIDPILQGECDAVFGSRMLTPGGARAGGMPWWKHASNVLLTKIENAVLGLRLSEYHSGYRAYSRRVLDTVRYEQNSDDFVFDSEIIVQLRQHRFRIHEIPIPTRYLKDASSVGLRRSIVYGLSIFTILGQYCIHRMGIRRYRKYT